MTPVIDLRSSPPPTEWGVTVDNDAIADLARRWAGDAFALPSFDYPGVPETRNESWWFDYATLSVAVLACLWSPEGEDVWQAELDDGQWLDDAPGIFAAFTRRLRNDGLDLHWFADLSDQDAADLFAGRGTLQLIPERAETLRNAARAILGPWSGSAVNLVAEAGRDGSQIAGLLTESMPGFRDRPVSSAGELRFDKLSHLAAAIMAAGAGWAEAGFHGFDDFPVYPDYMLPRVFRHVGIMGYSPALADIVDNRRLLAADSEAEFAIRWATVHSGHLLRAALNRHGNPVTTPALDYRLWSEAVLGPDADRFGEHHRTITLAY